MARSKKATPTFKEGSEFELTLRFKITDIDEEDFGEEAFIYAECSLGHDSDDARIAVPLSTLEEYLDPTKRIAKLEEEIKAKYEALQQVKKQAGIE